MSISNELQRMLTSNERGIFLTNDKKLELKALNEGVFSNIGADIASISGALFKKMKTIASKAGKALEHVINSIEISKFKKEAGVKNIDAIDEKLSLMAVNDPEFFALMHKLMTVTMKAKKSNKELYDSIEPIYTKNMVRIVDYYKTLLNHSTDDEQSKMYFILLHDIIAWLDKEKNKELINSIRNTTSSYLDRKATRSLTKSAVHIKNIDKKLLDDVEKIEYKLKKKMEQFDNFDMKQLSAQEKDIYRQYMKAIEDIGHEENLPPEKAREELKSQAAQPAAPAAPIPQQEVEQGIEKTKKKLNKKLEQITIKDLQELSSKEREIYIQAADKFIEEMKAGEHQFKIDPATGMQMADMDAVGAQLHVAETLAAAIKMRGKTFKTAPGKTPVKQPVGKPAEPAKPNPITANKPAAPAATAAPAAKPNPITAGKKL